MCRQTTKAALAAARRAGLGAIQLRTKMAPQIDLEAKPGMDRSLGKADLFIPLGQDAETPLFAFLRSHARPEPPRGRFRLQIMPIDALVKMNGGTR